MSCEKLKITEEKEKTPVLTLSFSAVPEKGRQPFAGCCWLGRRFHVCSHFTLAGRPVWPIILQHFDPYQSSQEAGTGHSRQAGPLNLVNRSRVGRHVSSICSLIGCPALSLFEADPLFPTSTIDFSDSCPHFPTLYDISCSQNKRTHPDRTGPGGNAQTPARCPRSPKSSCPDVALRSLHALCPGPRTSTTFTVFSPLPHPLSLRLGLELCLCFLLACPFYAFRSLFLSIVPPTPPAVPEPALTNSDQREHRIRPRAALVLTLQPFCSFFCSSVASLALRSRLPTSAPFLALPSLGNTKGAGHGLASARDNATPVDFLSLLRCPVIDLVSFWGLPFSSFHLDREVASEPEQGTRFPQR